MTLKKIKMVPSWPVGLEKLDTCSLGYMLSLAEAHGKLYQSSYPNLIMAVGRQSIWVVAVFHLTKDSLLKDLIFPSQLGCRHWSGK